MRYFLSLLFLIGCECTCHAQEPITAQEVGGVYKLETDQGLASCVGLDTPGHDHIHFLTINHAVEGNDLRVSVHGKEVPCSIVSRWESHPEPLVLIRSLNKFVGTFKAYSLAVEGIATTRTAYVVGFPSGRYTGKKTTVVDIQPLHGSYYVTDGISWHGTSGGAMLNEDGELVGIVSSISRKNKTTTCVNVLAATKRFKNTEKVQWRCTPRGCYMTCPPPANGYRVIERGSAGILGQRYERSVESSVPSPVVQQGVPYESPNMIEQGPAGPRGEQGPAGKDGLPGCDGKDGKVDQASIETAIATWLESNKEDLKGQTGLTGPAGRSVEKEDIQAAVNKWLYENFKQPAGSGEPVDLSAIESRLAAIEARKIRIVTSKGKVLVDDETYSGSQDDPIILNIDRILHAATTASK